MYMEALRRNSDDSLSSRWPSAFDFGECFVRPSDKAFYPCLIPVYNGKVLNIKSDLIHEGLSAISIKHYYGKCSKDVKEGRGDADEEPEGYDVYGEESPSEGFYGYELFGSEEQEVSSKSSINEREKRAENSMDDENPVKFPGAECTKERINWRNSFWNLHKPELCKLTWPQNYVSTATVTEHFHGHLVSHGLACAGVHDDEERENLLDKELAEYGRLKILAPPRDIPPDEKAVNFGKANMSVSRCKSRSGNDGCKSFSVKLGSNGESRFLALSDDEEITNGKSLRRSKEEFCLTIGRHMSKPAVKTSVIKMGNINTQVEEEYSAGEEESGFFYFNWPRLTEEECYEEEKDSDESSVDLEPIAPGLLIEPCPVLGMSDFCRAVAKADFSDLRCHPDDF